MEERVSIKKSLFDFIMKYLGKERAEDVAQLYVAITQDAQMIEPATQESVVTEKPMPSDV